MSEVARVVLGLEAPEVAEEVMSFLDRTERVRVVGAASDDQQLRAAIRQLEPDLVMVSPSLLPGDGVAAPVLALDVQESVRGLRAAIRAGARGFYVWPQERGALAEAAAGLRGVAVGGASTRGSIVAVIGARGGAGATFVSSHLSAAFAREGHGCVLVDLDVGFADLTAALGVPRDGSVRTLGDLVPVASELDSSHLDEALWRHPSGFRVALAPRDGDAVGADALRSVVLAAASASDVCVLHLPRRLDPPVPQLVELADRVVIVVALDVASIHGATRLVDAFGQDRVEVVVNRATRGEIVPTDVGRVLGLEPLAVLPLERAVVGAQDRGRLLPARSRSGRVLSGVVPRLLGAQR